MGFIQYNGAFVDLIVYVDYSKLVGIRQFENLLVQVCNITIHDE